MNTNLTPLLIPVGVVVLIVIVGYVRELLPTMSTHKIFIEPDGDLHYTYNDDLGFLLKCGEPSIRRASHVEPDENGMWLVDMSPVGGGKYGPFLLRRDALKFENDWLENNVLRTPQND